MFGRHLGEGGSSCRQRSVARGQRSQNRQPGFGLIGLGDFALQMGRLMGAAVFGVGNRYGGKQADGIGGEPDGCTVQRWRRIQPSCRDT